MATLKVLNHADLQISYVVMGAEAINASHLPCQGFMRNSSYAYENERQYHKEKASQEAIIAIACKLDPALLMESPTAIDGAPVVDLNGNVLGGNCRAMAIQYAYCHNGAENYKKAIMEHCKVNNIACNVENPILVRMLNEDIDARQGQELISLLNDAFTASKTKIADAYSRGTRFSTNTLKALANALSQADSLRAFFDTPASLPLIDMLINDGVIQYNERNAFIDGGYLNPQGKEIVEKALRSLVADNLESLSKIPAPVLAKVDAVIPYVLISHNIPTWSLISLMSGAIALLAEFVSSGEKEPRLFLNRCSMLQKAAIERYSKNEVRLFDMLRDMGKAELVKRFKEYAFQADISIENNGMGFGLPFPQAMKKIFSMDIDSAEQKVERPVAIQEVTAKKETTAKKEIKKMTAQNTGKNDCTKANSELICSVTCDKDNMQPIIAKAQETLGITIELTSLSKTQFKVNDTGYRIIRTGRQWQLRLLNDYVEAQANDPDNSIDTIEADNNKIEIAEDFNNKANIMEIDGRKFEFDSGKRITCQWKSHFSHPYNLRSAKAYAAYHGNMIIYKYGYRKEYCCPIRLGEATDIAWSEITELYYVDSSNMIYKMIREVKTEMQQPAELRSNKEETELKDDAPITNNNAEAVIKVEPVKPTRKQVMAINELTRNYKWTKNGNMLSKDFDGDIATIEIKENGIMTMQHCGNDNEIDLTDKVITAPYAAKYLNHIAMAAHNLKVIDQKRNSNAIDYNVTCFNKNELIVEFEKLGWECNEYKTHLKMDIKGNYRGELNPTGKRIVNLAIHQNTIRLQYGFSDLFQETILASMDIKEFAQNYHNKIIAWARKTGQYTNIETLDGALPMIENNLNKYLAMEYCYPQSSAIGNFNVPFEQELYGKKTMFVPIKNDKIKVAIAFFSNYYVGNIYVGSNAFPRYNEKEIVNQVYEHYYINGNNQLFMALKDKTCINWDAGYMVCFLRNRRTQIRHELIKLGWEYSKSGEPFININGGLKEQDNPTGKRIIMFAPHRNMVCLRHRWSDSLFTTEIGNNIAPSDIAKELHEKLIAWAKETGEYEDIETLDGALKPCDKVNHYQERIERKRAYYEQKAEQLESSANSKLEKAQDMSSIIPFGQPILVGHYSEKRDRNYRNRIHNTYKQSYEDSKKAEYYREKAEKIGNSGTISSDDPYAIDRLKEKLARLEDEHGLMKKVNSIAKNKRLTDYQKLEKLTELKMTKENAMTIIQEKGLPWYSLPYNLRAIKNVKARIAELEASQNANSQEIEYDICTYKEAAELNRVQIIFDGKPSAEIREILKSNGFRWAPSNKAWQRMNNENGRYAAKYVLKQIGAAKEPKGYTQYLAMPEYIAPKDYMPLEADNLPAIRHTGQVIYGHYINRGPEMKLQPLVTTRKKTKQLYLF